MNTITWLLGSSVIQEITKPIPQKYYITHAALGTWKTPEWQELIKPTLADGKTRRAYD